MAIKPRHRDRPATARDAVGRRATRRSRECARAFTCACACVCILVTARVKGADDDDDDDDDDGCARGDAGEDDDGERVVDAWDVAIRRADDDDESGDTRARTTGRRVRGDEEGVHRRRSGDDWVASARTIGVADGCGIDSVVE